MKIDKQYIFGKLLESTFKFNTKFENLLTSARFIGKELYEEYDVIVTSLELVRIHTSSADFHY